MPVATTYHVSTNREDLSDMISQLSNTEAPWFTQFGTGRQAAGKYHEWQTDELATPAENKHAEGASFSGSNYVARQRLGNWVQIFKKEPWVADTQEAIAVAGGENGVKSEYTYWVNKALKEVARDVDYAYKAGTGNSGASGTAAELKGVLAFIDENVTSGTSTAARDLTEDDLNDTLQSIWTNGGVADIVFAGGFNKRKISSFSTPSQRTVEMKGKSAIATIDVYESDFGKVNIQVDPILNAVEPDTVALLELESWKTSHLRDIHHQPLAKDGDRKRGLVVGELTLEARSPKHNGKITNLTVS